MLAQKWGLSPAQAEEMAEEAVNNETAGAEPTLNELIESGGGAKSGGGMDNPLNAGPPTATNVASLLQGRESGNPLLDTVAGKKTEAEKFAAARAKKKENVETSADPLNFAWNHLTLLKRRV